jgi:hypothetical protein
MKYEKGETIGGLPFSMLAVETASGGRKCAGRPPAWTMSVTTQVVTRHGVPSQMRFQSPTQPTNCMMRG